MFTWLMPFIQNNDNLTDIVLTDGGPIEAKCCRKIALAFRRCNSKSMKIFQIRSNCEQVTGIVLALGTHSHLKDLGLLHTNSGDD